MNIDQDFFSAVADGRISARTAIDHLVQAGHDRREATDLVFVTLGGGDLVQRDAAGVERYASGQSVAEIDRLMNL